jgi:hypothetical protein
MDHHPNVKDEKQILNYDAMDGQRRDESLMINRVLITRVMGG